MRHHWLEFLVDNIYVVVGNEAMHWYPDGY